jgi:hypothetical protein
LSSQLKWRGHAGGREDEFKRGGEEGTQNPAREQEQNKKKKKNLLFDRVGWSQITFLFLHVDY